MAAPTTSHAHDDPHGHGHDDHHHEMHWIWKYVFSSDHKMIGIQYGLTGLVFLFFGFCLMLAMRWQLAHPIDALHPDGYPLPVIGGMLASFGKFLADNHPLVPGQFDGWFWLRAITDQFPKGAMSADGY